VSLPDPRRWVADAMTLANGIFGFLSVLTWAVELGPLSSLPDPAVAAAYIGLGVVADGLDGVVARAWGSTGVGDALDSICDALTFSVAPAVFLVNMNEMVDGLVFRSALSLAAVALVLAGMLRLARHRTGGSTAVFHGLPTPWSAAALITVLLLGMPGWISVGLAFLLAGLNLSPVPYPKTRGAVFTRAALGLAVASLLVIGGLLVFQQTPDSLLWLAAIVAIGLVLLAPIAAPTGET
jgi:CDP-diacylglycerol--serine O-phosphatidyltransferase